LQQVFQDAAALRAMDPDTAVYRVELWEPVAPDTEGGLFWGATIIEPGRVGDEYFMTQGHFHALRNRAEFYCTASGEGMLLLMDEQRNTRAEAMSPGSLHYIPANTAHRAVNTGDTALCFWACWPSDAGHDYSSILDQGFSARVLLRNGAPALVPEVELAVSER
jgi:glucose-6-phosphate isomerase, archaeal